MDEITLSDDALAELRRAVLVEELDGLIFLNPDRYNENNPDIDVYKRQVVEALNESLGVVYRDVASTGNIVVIGRP